MTQRLGDMTWTEFESWRSAQPFVVLLVPLGSCEQHGPHLPVDTDLRIARILADAALDTSVFPFSQHVLIAPEVTVGASGEHADFPATLSIGTEVLTHVLVELTRSAMPEPALGRPVTADAVIFVNGHGGNIEACTNAVAVLQHEGRLVSAWHPQVPTGDSHAGRTETSMLLAQDPETVRLDNIAEGTLRRWREIGPEVAESGLRSVTPTGVLGDPRPATSDEGAAVLAELVSSLRAHIAEICQTLEARAS